MSLPVSKTNYQKSPEDELWAVLKMDSFDIDMKSGEFSPSNQVVMGTGRTQNACEMCSNSSTTHGCGGC